MDAKDVTEAAAPDAGSPDADGIDEMVTGAGRLRPAWRPLIGALHAMQEGAFAERASRILRQQEEGGLAYLTPRDPGERRISRQPLLDPMPMILPAAEWERLTVGLDQRARLLNAIAGDLYGERRLLQDRHIPPALVYANPRFQRPCVGIEPPAGRHLHVYAADLVRLPDGVWHVASDRMQSPSGIGFALHNRALLARALPELFRAAPVQRLEPFFELWQTRLASLAPRAASAGPPRTALLTPGRFSPAFLEHVFLARQLSAVLVEGGDLTMRDGRVFLKTLASLQPVDVLLRFIDDDFADPLELRSDSVLGVPGLLQAVRNGTLAVVNALGGSVAETPALRPFLPALCRHLLGETLSLPSVPTEWLGEPATFASLAALQADFVVKPAYATLREEIEFVETTGAMTPEAVRALVAPRPEAFVAEAKLRRSSAPCWAGEGLEPKPIGLRAYLLHDGERYVALPGAYVQLAAAENRPITVDSRSKDAWVTAGDTPLPFSQRAGAPPRVAIGRPGDDLRSRAADDLFWFGRYGERLDNAARLMRATALRLAVDRVGPGQAREIQHLLRMMVEGRLIEPRFAELRPDGAQLFPALAASWRGDASLPDLFLGIRRIAQALRDRLSGDMWTSMLMPLSAAERVLADRPADADALIAGLDRLIGVIAAFGGLASENMTRGVGWRFLDIGRRLERGLYTCSALAELIDGTEREGEGPLALVLEICDSSITYHSRYLGALQAGPVADLLLAEDANPRGVAFQLRGMSEHLRDLSERVGRGQASVGAAELRELVTLSRSVPLAVLDEGALPGGRPPRAAFGEAMRAMRRGMFGLSDTITRSFFSHTRLPHAVGYGRGGEEPAAPAARDSDLAFASGI